MLKNFIYDNIDQREILSKYNKNHIEGTLVKYINNKNHPACNQYGLFATKDWNKFVIIGEYTGEIIDSYNDSEYLVAFTNISISICIDAEKHGNECRFINHYKNIIKKPNCKYVPTYVNRKPIILIVVIENIKIGEEICSDYCFDFN